MFIHHHLIDENIIFYKLMIIIVIYAGELNLVILNLIQHTIFKRIYIKII